MGYPNFIVVTDHKPQKGLFGDRDLSSIPNSFLFRLKKKPQGTNLPSSIALASDTEPLM